MDEIVIELDVSQESWAVKTVKERMTAWANEIPHHPYENLGDLVHIETIHYRPSYVISLQTQYEMRDKRSKEEAYYGTSIPPLRYTSLSQVNEWGINLGKYSDFTDSDKWYYVEGSQKVSQCSTCGGRGRTTCSSCGGTGIVTCSSCRGAGTTNCWKCSGTGNERKSCSSCGGSGSKWNQTLNRNEKCYSCSGKGTWLEKCWSCNGTGRKKCTTCSGTGRVSCSSCSGKGYNTCWNCSGQGRVMESFQVRQKLSAHQEIISLNHDKVKKDFPHFSLNTKKNKGEVVLVLDESTLDSSELDNWPPLATVFKEMHQQALAVPEENTRITRQKLMLFKTVVCQVKYTLDNSEYHLLVSGEEGDVFAPINPISQLRDRYVESAENYYNEKKYYEAWHQVKTAMEMGEDEPGSHKEKIEAVADGVKTKILGQYRLGQIAAAALAILAFIPLIFGLFSSGGFLLPVLTEQFNTFPWMSQIHPYVLYFLFMIGLLRVYSLTTDFITRHFMFRVAENFARVWLGAAFFFAFTTFYWVLLVILNATGFTLTLTYLAKLLADSIGMPIG